MAKRCTPAQPTAAKRCGAFALASELAWALASLCWATTGHAALGADLASVAADQQAWGAHSTQTALGAVTVHSLALPNGITLRQYADAGGLVFAVAWDGPVLPDFERLLGAHFAAYAQAVRQPRHGVSLYSADLVLVSGGKMRAFSGRAFVPGKVPASLSAQDIR
jgi:Protein of unknown function (DUF2844)